MNATHPPKVRWVLGPITVTARLVRVDGNVPVYEVVGVALMKRGAGCSK